MFTLRLLFSSTRNMMLKLMIIQKPANYKQNFLIFLIFFFPLENQAFYSREIH